MGLAIAIAVLAVVVLGLSPVLGTDSRRDDPRRGWWPGRPGL